MEIANSKLVPAKAGIENQNNHELMTLDDLAGLIGCSQRTVLRKLQNKELPPPAVGRVHSRTKTLWSKKAVLAFIDRQQGLRIRDMEHVARKH